MTGPNGESGTGGTGGTGAGAGAGGGGTGGTGTGGTGDWRAAIPEGLRDRVVELPAADAPADAWAAVEAKLPATYRAPDKPDAYTFEAPKEAGWDEGLAGRFRAALHEAKAPPGLAPKLAAWLTAEFQRGADAAKTAEVEAAKAETAKSEAALKTALGATHDAQVETVRRLFLQGGAPEAVAALHTELKLLGADHYTLLMRTLAKAAEVLVEGPVPRGGAQPGAAPVAPEDKLYPTTAARKSA